MKKVTHKTLDEFNKYANSFANNSKSLKINQTRQIMASIDGFKSYQDIQRYYASKETILSNSTVPVLSILSNAGGSGKTACTSILAEYFTSFMNKKVLLVDFCSQKNLTHIFLRDVKLYEDSRYPIDSIFTLLMGKSIKIHSAQVAKNTVIDIISGDERIESITRVENNKEIIPQLLRELFSSFSTGDYDLIIVDCSCTKEMIQIMSSISTHILIPIGSSKTHCIQQTMNLISDSPAKLIGSFYTYETDEDRNKFKRDKEQIALSHLFLSDYANIVFDKAIAHQSLSDEYIFDFRRFELNCLGKAVGRHIFN